MRVLIVERWLRFSVASVLVACGSTVTTGGDAGGDAGTDAPIGCGGCGCADSSTTHNYSTTYAVCASTDAGALDASDDASADAAACFADCSQACQAAATKGEFATCLGESDGGASRVAQCESVVECTGRRPDGLAPQLTRATTIGEVLARAAWLEAASVVAFRRLARELRAHGAPAELVRVARASARDEIRHTRAMRALAERHGASVPRVVIEPSGVRDLEAIARENAVEACVAETLGAVLASYQSAHAQDPGVRAAMRTIAPDELRHASLGWAVAAWIEPRLDADARARVEDARAKAIEGWLQNTPIELAPSVSRALGLPNAATAKALGEAMVARDVWRRAA